MRAPTLAALSSTNVPTFASGPSSVSVRIEANGPISTPLAMRTSPRMTVNGWIDDVRLDLDVSVDPRRGGVDDRDAREHVRGVDAVAQPRGNRRELGARVDAVGLERILRALDRARLPVADEDAERVGDVELALRVVRRQPFERRPELRRVEDVDAGVDLAERELLGRGVARLDDPREPAVRVPHDPAVCRGVGRLEGEDGRGGSGGAMRLDERGDRLRPQRGHVAVEDEDVAVEVAERLARAADGVAGAARLLLHGDVDAVVELARRRRGDDDDPLHARPARGLDDPVDHPPAEQRMEVLRRRALHARADPSGHHDCCERLHVSTCQSEVAGAPGFEPGITGPKPVALPLGYAPGQDAILAAVNEEIREPEDGDRR